MEKIQVNTTSELITQLCLDFYDSVDKTDPYGSGLQRYARVPQIDELPELYQYVRRLGYQFPDQRVRGNFFETSVGYNVHTDDSQLTFLLPLILPEDCHSYLFILDQSYDHEPASFRREVTSHNPSYRRLFHEYDDSVLLDYNIGKWDERLETMIPHINSKTFKGMSVDTIFKWKTEKLISFPSNRLHFSTTNSDKRKTGLSFRVNLYK